MLRVSVCVLSQSCFTHTNANWLVHGNSTQLIAGQSKVPVVTARLKQRGSKAEVEFQYMEPQKLN